jgi:hypothetical protein
MAQAYVLTPALLPEGGGGIERIDQRDFVENRPFGTGH